ncbi:MAG: LysR family transcriptional regulator [Rhodospirillales bacterium]
MIKTEMLRAFVEVAQAGSLRDGANALGRTPSAVSMTLKNLEDHLGRPLFESERKNRLTPLGVFTLEMAERELEHFSRTVRAVEDFAGARSGKVRIAAVPSYAGTELAAIVGAFLRLHTKVRLDIRDLDSASILRELERGRIDLGIVSNARENPELRRISLGSDPFGLVIRADDPLACPDRIRWDDLTGVPLITHPLCETIDAPRLQAAIAAARLRVHNTTTIVGMVRAGLGVTVLPELVTQSAAPGLIFRRLEEPVVWRKLYLLMRRRDTPNPATAAFAEFVAQWPHASA